MVLELYRFNVWLCLYLVGDKRKMAKDKWFLNGGRGSGKTFRLLCETYGNKIAELKRSCEEIQKLLDKQIEATYKLDKENAELREKYLYVVNRSPCLAELEQNINKARGLLKKFIFLLRNPRTALDTKTVMNEAEQFLKDSEVEK
jgi:hypothetical protein